MIITIAGNLGSGKSTVCTILKEKYNFTIYSTGKIQREYAERMGISTLEMNKLMNTDPKYDHIIDDEVVRISKQATSPMVFDSRMAWHFVDKSLKVFLIVNPQVAAERVFTTRESSVENYASLDDAREKLLERAKTENERYQQIYQVNNFDYRNYDLIIDTTHIPPEQVASLIYDAYCNEAPAESPTIFISPQNVYPTQTFGEFSMERIEQYRSQKTEEKAPIVLTHFNGYHYVIDGHHRLLAALIDQKPVIAAKLLNPDEYPLFQSQDALPAQLKAVGVSAVYDFETIGNFRYLLYPGAYRGESCDT